MNRNELVNLCRYYKGEQESPFAFADPRFTAWRIEALWVVAATNQAEMLNFCVEDYIRHGLAGFQDKDGVPISLKAFLMNRLFQYAEREDVEDFKQFYLNHYLR